MEEQGRVAYLDLLRVLATVGVMLLHVSCINWYSIDVTSYEWAVLNFYDSIVRWTVPVFVMISGALFLNRDISIKTMYCKYILRLVVAFVVWGMIYAVYTGGTVKDLILNGMGGYYHLWFLPMMIGLYMCSPVLRKIVKSGKQIVYYYLILAGIFSFLLPAISRLSSDFAPNGLNEVLNVISGDIQNMNMDFVLGYPFYFILGYVIATRDIPRKVSRAVYVCGICGFLSTFFLDWIIAIKTQQPCDKYYYYFCMNVLGEALFVFLFIKEHCIKNKKVLSIVHRLSEYSFGAYLIHALVIELIHYKIGIDTMTFNTLVAVPVITLSVFVGSFAVSMVLNHIPIIKKYIV